MHVREGPMICIKCSVLELLLDKIHVILVPRGGFMFNKLIVIRIIMAFLP